MRLLAQHGFGPSDKLTRAVQERLIDGIIFSPRYLEPAAARDTIDALLGLHGELEILLDPEYYAIQHLGMPNAQLGRLAEGDWKYFVPHRLTDLLTDSQHIDGILASAFEAQLSLGCTALVAPSIYIGKSFDSLDAAISLAFFARTSVVGSQVAPGRRVFATLAVTRNALMNQQDLDMFLATLTAIEPKPHGLYLLVGAGSGDDRGGTLRSEMMIPGVIAGWMLFNYSLRLNGLRVINGCSDLLSPILAIAGAEAGATGWWSTLQVFSMGRYIRGPGGGQQPLKRYVSIKLLNRITVNERELFVSLIPSIANDLPSDTFYAGTEPSRTEEALQGWEALHSLIDNASSGDVGVDLERFGARIDDARTTYEELRLQGYSERYEASMEYLEAMRQGLTLFRTRAEL